MKQYTGRADTVDKAIKDAVVKALANQYPDKMINFILKEVKGQFGGIAGFHQVEVVIEEQQDDCQQICKHALEYQAYQYNDIVTIIAYGQHNTSGFKVEMKLKLIDIFPPQYKLMHVVPNEPVAQVITPFIVSVSFQSKEIIKTVKVEGGTGENIVRVKQR